MKSALTPARELLGLFAIDQFAHIDLECDGESLDHQGGRIAYSAFYTADIATVKPTVGGKVLLGDGALLAQPPQVPANALANVHRKRGSARATD